MFRRFAISAASAPANVGYARWGFFQDPQFLSELARFNFPEKNALKEVSNSISNQAEFEQVIAHASGAPDMQSLATAISNLYMNYSSELSKASLESVCIRAHNLILRTLQCHRERHCYIRRDNN